VQTPRAIAFGADPPHRYRALVASRSGAGAHWDATPTTRSGAATRAGLTIPKRPPVSTSVARAKRGSWTRALDSFIRRFSVVRSPEVRVARICAADLPAV
jgi:hypothetical protein